MKTNKEERQALARKIVAKGKKENEDWLESTLESNSNSFGKAGTSDFEHFKGLSEEFKLEHFSITEVKKMGKPDYFSKIHREAKEITLRENLPEIKNTSSIENEILLCERKFSTLEQIENSINPFVE